MSAHFTDTFAIDNPTQTMANKKNDKDQIQEAELLERMQEDIRNRKSALMKLWNTYKNVDKNK